MSFDALIVGAGIVGAACAERLAREGLGVCVLEASSQVGSGATAAGMGHIVAMDDSEAQFALTRYSQSLWESLEGELPAACEMTQPGTLWVAEDDEEMAVVQSKAAYYRQRDVDCEVLTAAELRLAEPQLRADLKGALKVPGDRVVYPPVAVSFLLDRAKRLGADIRLDQAVRQVRSGEVELDCGTVIEAREVIVAAGCATQALLEEPSAVMAIRPRKGHLCISDRYPGFLNHQIVELGYLKSAHSAVADSVAFNVQPRATGQVLVGSSRQFEDQTPHVNSEIVRRMIERAVHFMPGLSDLQVVRTWTGFRAATEDHLPLIGRHAEGICIAGGHEGLGITTSLGTAELICDLVHERPSAIDRLPYRVDREVAHA